MFYIGVRTRAGRGGGVVDLYDDTAKPRHSCPLLLGGGGGGGFRRVAAVVGGVRGPRIHVSTRGRQARPRPMANGLTIKSQGGEMGVAAYYERTQQEGRQRVQEEGREGGESTRWPVVRRGATPHRTPA